MGSTQPDLHITDQQLETIRGTLGKTLGVSPEGLDPGAVRAFAVKIRKAFTAEKKAGPLQRVARCIPGTSSFRRHFARKAIFHSNCGLLLFLSLKAVPISARRKLNRRLKRIEHQVCVWEARESVFKRPGIPILSYSAAAIAFVLGPILVRTWTGFGMLTWRILAEYLVSYLIALNLTTLPSRFLARRKNLGRSSVLLGFLLWPFSVCTGYFWLGRQMLRSATGPHFGGWQHAFIAALASTVLLYVCVFLIVSFYIVFSLLVDFHKRRASPVATLVDELMSMLNELERKRGSDLTQFATKVSLVRRMERAAAAVERTEVLLRSGDPWTESWFAERTSQIASGIRSLKRWVLTPKHDTLEHLKARIAQLLEMAIAGDWGAMTTVAPEGAALAGRPAASWIGRAVRVLRLSLFVLVPLGVAIAIRLGFILPQGTMGYLAIGVAIWLSIVASVLLEPEKITNLRELAEFFAITWRKP